MNTHVVLIHGAWHEASTWDTLRPSLHDAGFTTSAISLPSVSGSGTPHSDTTEDTATIRNEFTRVADAGHDIIAVLHSYGGIPGSDACEGLSKQERAVQGKKGGIIHVIYLAAFMLVEGQTLLEALKDESPAWFLNMELVPGWACVTEENAVKAFYHEMDVETAMLHVAKLKPQSPGPFVTPQKYAPWLHSMPATYVVAELDRAIEPYKMDMMMSAKGWTGGVFKIKAQHCLYLTHPEEIVEVVKHAAKRSEA